MLKDDIRHARTAAGLSQSELARRAGVPRKQVQALENGANITMETLRRIAPALPNLKRVTIGGLEVAMENVDLEAARQAALDLFDVSKRLMAALGAFPPRSTVPAPKAKAVEGPLPGGGGAEVYDALMDMTPELRAHLQGLIEEIKKNKGRKGRHPSSSA